MGVTVGHPRKALSASKVVRGINAGSWLCATSLSQLASHDVPRAVPAGGPGGGGRQQQAAGDGAPAVGRGGQSARWGTWLRRWLAGAGVA